MSEGLRVAFNRIYRVLARKRSEHQRRPHAGNAGTAVGGISERHRRVLQPKPDQLHGAVVDVYVEHGEQVDPARIDALQLVHDDDQRFLLPKARGQRPAEQQPQIAGVPSHIHVRAHATSQICYCSLNDPVASGGLAQPVANAAEQRDFVSEAIGFEDQRMDVHTVHLDACHAVGVSDGQLGFANAGDARDQAQTAGRLARSAECAQLDVEGVEFVSPSREIQGRLPFIGQYHEGVVHATSSLILRPRRPC